MNCKLAECSILKDHLCCRYCGDKDWCKSPGKCNKAFNESNCDMEVGYEQEDKEEAANKETKQD